MPIFFDTVTELVTKDDLALQLKVFCCSDDNPEDGLYLTHYQVGINGHREVSSDKYVNLSSILYRPIELRIFTAKGFSGVVLTPLHIRNHVRLIFTKHREYETNGKVLVRGIAKADLPNPRSYTGRRGCGKLLGRDAYYRPVKMRIIVGSSDEVP